MTPRKRPAEMAAADIEAALGSGVDPHARPEAVVLRLRRHGRHLTLPVLLLFAICAAAGYWVGALPEPWMNLLAGAGALTAGLLFVLLPVLLWLTQRITVTTRRVIMRRGFFVRHRAEIPLSRVREVRTRRTIGQRICGSGTVELHFGSEYATLSDVPGVRSVADGIQELVELSFAQAQQYSGGFDGSVHHRAPGHGGTTGQTGRPVGYSLLGHDDPGADGGWAAGSARR